MWWGVIAQSDAPLWWDTVPTRITVYGTACLTLLALLKKVIKGSSWLRRLALALNVLGDTERYPNGSTDLVTALRSIYTKQTELGAVQEQMAATQTRLLGEVKSLSESLEDHMLNGHR